MFDRSASPMLTVDARTPPASGTLPPPAETPTTPTALSMVKTPVLAEKGRSPSFPKFLRRPQSKRSSSMDSTTLPTTLTSTSSSDFNGPPSPALSASGAATPTSSAARRARFRKSWSAKNTDYNLGGNNDILGIVMLEVKNASDLPKLKNSTYDALRIRSCADAVQ